jgi:hypothetical protein
MLGFVDGKISEKIRSPKNRPNARKWESHPERTQYEGLWQAISSSPPLPCYPPTKTI